MKFKNEHLSVSRVKLYETCPKAFYFQYVSKGYKAPPQNATQFGNVLHEALETTYRRVVEQEYAGEFPRTELLAAYMDAWQASRMVGVDLYQEGIGILKRYADTVGTVDHLSVLGIEQEFNVQVGEFVINGLIDRIDKLGSDHVQVVDYKSNRKVFTKDELLSDAQMSVYGMVVKQRYPWARVITFRFFMLRHGIEQPVTRTADSFVDIASYFVAMGRRIESDETWEARLNANCGYCDHRLRCEEYETMLQSRLEPFSRTADLATIFRQLEHVSKFAKMAYARKREIENFLAAKLEEGDQVVGDFNVSMGAETVTFYPVTETLRALRAAGVPPAVAEQVVTCDAREVSALCEQVSNTNKRMVLRAELASIAEKRVKGNRVELARIKPNKGVA